MSNQNHISSLNKIRSNLYGQIKNKRNGEFVDCCKVYKFNLEIETRDFNNTINELGIVHLLMDDGNPKKKDDHGYDLTEMFERDIANFVKIGTNMILGIIGNVGSGKSELAMLVLLICKAVNKNYRKREVDHHLCWEMKDVLNVFPILKKGDVVWKDEMPKSTRKGSRTQEWEVNNVLRVVRAFQNTFIFVDPLDIKVDICNLYFESAGMNKKNRSNRFLVLNKYRRYIGHIYVALHTDEEFRNNYLKKKDEFIQDSLNNKGLSKADNNTEDVELNDVKNDINKEPNKEKPNDKIDKKVRILKAIIKNNDKNKARDIFILEHYSKDKERYTFEELGETFEIAPETVRGIFFKLKREIKNHPNFINLNLFKFSVSML